MVYSFRFISQNTVSRNYWTDIRRWWINFIPALANWHVGETTGYPMYIIYYNLMAEYK